MIVLQVPYTYFPDASGGTENYVSSLAKGLLELGIESLVAAPATDDKKYDWNGIKVYRYRLSKNLGLEELYGDGDPVAAEAFSRILDEVKPDIVHFHALTSGASVLSMREVKKRGIPLVFTYHTPTVSCVRGTMMKWGKVPCRGKMESVGCTACSLNGRGLPKASSQALTLLPKKVTYKIGSKMKSGKHATALQMPYLVGKRIQASREVFQIADRIVVVCGWVRDVLLRNGVSEKKLIVSRQGLPSSFSISSNKEVNFFPKSFSFDRPLRLAYFGRLDPTKGVHIVIEAMLNIKDSPITLDIYGITQGDGGEDYKKQLLALTKNDKRIKLNAPIESERVINEMSQYDLIVIPSQLLETGPLTVYEAFAAGVPVLGSAIGGIPELVNDKKNGRLLPHDNILSWVEELGNIISKPGLIENWSNHISPPRLMAEVADEMVEIYCQYR